MIIPEYELQMLLSVKAQYIMEILTCSDAVSITDVRVYTVTALRLSCCLLIFPHHSVYL